MKKITIFRSFLILLLVGAVMTSCRRDIDLPTGPQGEQGEQGDQGPAGENGLTPHIVDGFWFIGEENTEVPATGADGLTPYINEETGTWFIGEFDTEIKAQGPAGEDGAPGADGETPDISISEGGTWVINGEDTGVKVQGEDGLTPFIGTNGNWWIGEEDTGVPAYTPDIDDAYSTSGWEVTVNSNQSGDGGGPDALIDGDYGTFWTAQWSPSTDRPDTITVDMKAVSSVSAFYFVQRQEGASNWNNHPNKITIEVSDDGSDWDELGTDFKLKVGDLDPQLIVIPQRDFQYFRIIIVDQADVGGEDINGNLQSSVEPSLGEIVVIP